MWFSKRRAEAFKVSTRQSEKVTIIELAGKLVLGNKVWAFRRTIEGLLNEGRKLILLDLRRVPYMDAWGIGEVAAAMGRLDKAGGALRVLLPSSGKVADLFALADFRPPFEVFVDENVALKSF